MKIAVATTKGGLDDQVSPFFGRCPIFTLVEAEGNGIKNAEIIQNEFAAAAGGAGIQASQFIAEKKVEAAIAGNFGPNAARILASVGIKMVQSQGSVKDAIMGYLSGSLKPASGSTVEGHFGMGQGGGMGQGRGQGMGRGMGRGLGMGLGLGMQQPPMAQAPTQPTPQSKEQELATLEEQAGFLEKELEQIKRRIKELKK